MTMQKISLSCLATVLATSSLCSAQVASNQGQLQPTDLLPYSLPRMVNPSIDVPGQPFSFPSRPTDQISVMGSPAGTEITPEGYLYTGYGELMFFLGVDRIPLNQRVRTLEEGYLPVLQYEQEHDGLIYRFTTFAASLGPSQDGSHVVNFVRVTVHNPGTVTRRGFVTSAWRYNGEQTSTFGTGDDRFRRPVDPPRIGAYTQPGDSFRPDSSYTTKDGTFLRDGKVIYAFPSSPTPALAFSYRGYYSRRTPITTTPAAETKPPISTPTTPMALAEYALEVPAGQDRSLDFKMPLAPLSATDPMLASMQKASLDASHAAVRTFWSSIVKRGMQITTPEEKVNDTFRASLVNDLLSLGHVGSDWIQTINVEQYHGFYLRDSSDFVRMYDTTGYPDIGRRVTDFFGSRQQPDGNFLSQPGQYDGWGYAMLTYGQHYRYTHDRAFAESVYPRVVRAVQWLEKATAADPLHLLPATDVHDNEYIPGHLTGYNFIALDGLRYAQLLAHDLGHPEDEKRFHAVETELRRNFMARLDTVTQTTGGYIPPALDGNNGGADWGNLLSLTPEMVLSPSDPRVLATLHATQARYQEGLMAYREPNQGTYLHHYLTIKNTLTELILGEQEQAIRELYAVLVHTSATHAGFEYSIRPWADRDFMGNMSPHGWFAVEYRNLLRSMMVREQDDTLHILSAISPAWFGEGKQIKVQNAPTAFGNVSFVLSQTASDTAQLTLDTTFREKGAPTSVVLHLPWFMDVTEVQADGQVLHNMDHNTVSLPLHTKVVLWKFQPHTVGKDVPVTYDDAVNRYKAEYRKRYEEQTLPDASH